MMRTMRHRKVTMKLMKFGVLAMAALSSFADETVSVDTQLSADRTVSGTLFIGGGTTLDLNGHNLTANVLAAAADADDLPGYKILEYIQSSGSQWLCTGYTPAGTDRVEMKLELTSIPGSSSWGIFFCSRGASNANSFLSGIQGSTTFRVDHKASGTTAGITYSLGFSTRKLYTISVDGNTGACKVNGSTVLKTDTGKYETATGPFCILGAHLYGADLAEHRGTALSFIPSCKIYSFQVYDKNGVLQCDIVPALRTSDGVIGMYDRERDMFFENYGTGNFGAGPRANVTITNSSHTVSECRVNVASDTVSTNTDVIVSGNIRLVKNGEGTYFAKRSGQNYSAGTRVDAGTLMVNGRGTEALLGSVAGNLVKNGGFDEGSVTLNSGNWGYGNGNGFSCPSWTLSNPAYIGLSKSSGVWISNLPQINELIGTYGLYMKSTDGSKGHSGDLSVSQGGLMLSQGLYRISYNYTTRTNAMHAPVTHVVNLIHGNVTNKVGEATVEYEDRTMYKFAEWHVEIGEENEGEYTLQFLQTIAANGPNERTTILDNIVMEKVSPADVVVNSGATVMLASGARDFSDYRFVMNGGTLLNSSGANNVALVKRMILLDDSTWENTAYGGFFAPGDGDTLLDLGGKTLSVVSENSLTLYLKNTTITNGTLVLPEHLFVNFEGNGVDASTARIVSANLFRMNAPAVVRDFEERRTGGAGGSIGESGSLSICGTFKPVTRVYPALALLDGAVLDLSESSFGVSVSSPALTFADGATIAIKLGGGHVRNPLISWTTPPANLGTLTFVKTAGEGGYALDRRDDGLYALRGFTVIMK